MRFRSQENPADLGHLILMLYQLRQLLVHREAVTWLICTAAGLLKYMLFGTWLKQARLLVHSEGPSLYRCGHHEFLVMVIWRMVSPDAAFI